MAEFDPYEVLGLPRDASEDDVRAAYRRVAKETHPDVAPDREEEFHRAKRAELVLMNPARRQKFDSTGAVDDEQPDNKRATALQIIDQFFAAVVNEFVKTGYKQDDPRRRDLVREFREHAGEQMSGASLAEVDGRKYIAFLKDMRRRFKTTEQVSPIQRGLDRQIRNAEQQLDQIKESLECLALAVSIVEAHEFDADAPQPRWASPYEKVS